MALGRPSQRQQFLETNFQLTALKLKVKFPEVNVGNTALVSHKTFMLEENSQKNNYFWIIF